MLGSKDKAPELTRVVKSRLLPASAVVIEADERERAALAERFSLVSVETLDAEVGLELCKKGIRAEGGLRARITQACAVSGEPFTVEIEEPIALRFIEQGTAALTPSEEDEIDYELTADDCDEIEYSGDSFDLGEAVAQTLGLAIDPYAEGPGASDARKKAGIVEEGQQDGPLAAGLAALRKET
ncbi:MAG: DUF177 domain-containing protein [Erythrobacter sp.]|uniref:YceD family protein n=1 Tax=Erythrobacter sp. TaxID=1042 RepID=UPI002619415E|nr:DUF177 domain-containing protein [Erythrobacter sp.]MDJ0978985.1 DUF177 domain-containing protein [Erythrobacter sp.]